MVTKCTLNYNLSFTRNLEEKHLVFFNKQMITRRSPLTATPASLLGHATLHCNARENSVACKNVHNNCQRVRYR
jgi:hypothetical protein